MTANWRVEQIKALAPDAASVKAAQKLTSSSKWPLLEYNQQAVWGHCQGSGSKPYQTRIDFSEPAFKCSCPSHKFPCKHGLALFILYAEETDAFTEQQQAPAWVQEWLDSRTERKTKQAEKKANAKPVDAAAQAKRQQQREAKVSRGVEELGLWLQDLVRGGFAELPEKPYKFWDDMRARMIDAQAPGLANWVSQLANAALSGPQWADRLSKSVGQLHLLLQAYQRIDQCPAQLQADIRALVGWPVNKDEVLKTEPVVDDWAVLATATEQQQQQQDSLLSQRIWLYGQKTQQMTLILNFAHEMNRRSLNISLAPGQVVQGPVYFYPSATPLRAIEGDLKTITSIDQLVGAESIATALDGYHSALSKNPWLGRYPLLLNNVRIHAASREIVLLDSNNALLPVSINHDLRWSLLALCGSNPVTVFGLWNGEQLQPFAIVNEYGHRQLTKMEEAA